MSDKEPEQSPLTQKVTVDDKTVEIDIYRGDEGGWILEIVDEGNNSTMWEDEFASDEEALAEAKTAIREDGIDAYIGAHGQSGKGEYGYEHRDDTEPRVEEIPRIKKGPKQGMSNG
ncbi:hypothetical protein [Pseudidiomarina salinarum]|uniref:hypothetical protein n=1 Tax=Pseudidiomarina salinarum TaxID=435908 RepID=UPI000AD7BD52|nr:hypothetical protein [Pseudidiomarina salinarum]